MLLNVYISTTHLSYLLLIRDQKGTVSFFSGLTTLDFDTVTCNPTCKS